LLDGEDVGRPNFALSCATLGVGVSLIVGLSSRRTYLQQETALFGVVVIDLALSRRASGRADE
jgi:hypothetical protein